MKYLSNNQIKQSIKNAAERNQFYYTLILTLAKTGCRVSELTNIRTQDILQDEKQLVVRGKGNKIRNIDVPDDLLLQLRVFIRQYKIRKGSRLFPRSRQNITQITKRFIGANAHAFRHSYAINLLRTTNNIRYVQLQLGHTSLTTTQIYLRFMEYTEEKNKLGRLYT